MSDDDQLIDGQYMIIEPVASGSSSQVLEVSEKGSTRHLAMKLLKKDVPEFKENKAVMKAEAQIMKNLDHPLIVKFEKFVTNRDNTYILMDYFRAANLKLQIKSYTNQVHLKIRPLFESVCSALSYVHQKGYIHRDIKPDNILMNRAGEVRLCDFSLAIKEVKGIGKMFAGRMKSIQGTRTYIAPETIRRLQPTISTDIYSLGILFYEVLTKRTPFQATSPEELLQKHLKAIPPTPSEFNPNIAPEMDRLIARMLKKTPAERPANVDEILAEIKRIRIFKEDIVDESVKAKESENSDAVAALSEARLDSRADAKLAQMVQSNPEFAKQYQQIKAEKEAKKKAEKEREQAKAKLFKNKPDSPEKPKAAAPSPAPAAPQPAQPMPMQMPMPGYPMMPPGYGMMPQQPMPMQMPMQPGMMPGMPQYPVPPQMGYPQQMMPGQMQPPPQPGIRPQAAPAAPNPAARPPQAGAAPSTPQPPRPAASPASRPAPPPQPKTSGEDMDFMTDLPDVL